ncbi:DUF7304 family protein, partial [Mycolicibacter arupensis]|uniref:DUF7304 family protein n=1 Tax=Mycolicibacter arupensis TaxID=342002 RepID=UPI003B3AC234
HGQQDSKTGWPRSLGTCHTDPAQPNLIDGSIYAYEQHQGGVYVTVKGAGETPLILSFDSADIDVLRNVFSPFPVSTGQCDFTHYVDPREVLEGNRLLHVGLGRTGDGVERGYLGVGDQNRYGSVLLTPPEVVDLIQALVDVLGTMAEGAW